jgi:hypothetical protein
MRIADCITHRRGAEGAEDAEDAEDAENVRDWGLDLTQ